MKTAAQVLGYRNVNDSCYKLLSGGLLADLECRVYVGLIKINRLDGRPGKVVNYRTQ